MDLSTGAYHISMANPNFLGKLVSTAAILPKKDTRPAERTWLARAKRHRKGREMDENTEGSVKPSADAYLAANDINGEPIPGTTQQYLYRKAEKYFVRN